MRILVIAPEQLPVPPVKGGSVETVIYQTFRRMSRNHSVILISRSHRSLPSRSKKENGRFQIIRVKPGNRYRYIQAALRKVKGKSFDIIQVENRPTFVPHVRRYFRKTPIVLSLHSLTFMSLLSNRAAKRILKQTNAVSTVSTYLTGAMKRRFPGQAYKFRSTRLGVDLGKFRPRSRAFKHQLRRQWGGANGYNVLFVGRIVPRKGLHTLVRAVALLKKRYGSIRLIAIGSSWPGVKAQSPYIRNVRRLSKKLGVPIRFTGYVPPARIAKLYHLADVFVCPSQYREGFSMVNTEAMASGIPVIASSRGGIRNIIRHGKSGLLVNAYTSPLAFAKRLAQLKASPALAQRLAAGGRSRALAAYSWSNRVQRLMQLYQAIRHR